MTKDQRSAIVSSLVTDVAIPEILGFIRKRHAETGEIPSEAEIRAQLAADAGGVIARGEAFLRQHALLKAPVITDVSGYVVGGE